MATVAGNSLLNRNDDKKPVGHFVTKQSTLFLDGLRGLAAIYVLVCHAGTLLYTRHPIPAEVHFTPAPRWLEILNALLLAPFGHGDYAVLFFFVLSGFVIHIRQAKALSADRRAATFVIRSYLYRRIRRLYPPLLLALLLTAALDAVGQRMGYAIYFDRTPYFYLNQFSMDHSLRTFLGNVFFCQGLIVPRFGSDGPLWSLAYEGWFYLIYPLLWPVLRRNITAACLLVAAMFFLAMAPDHWPTFPLCVILRKVFMLLPAWWIGVVLAEMHSGRWKLNLLWLSPLLSIMVLADRVLPMLLARIRMPNSGVWLDVRFYVDLDFKALGIFGLLALVMALKVGGFRFRLLDRLGFLGDMSYTLYVIHVPMLVLFTGWYMSRSADGHIPHQLGPFFFVVATIVATAWLLHFIVERPFSRSHNAHAGSKPAV